ncbi:MAG TPA: hypothetical protein PK325_07480 [Cyclobacteriaceae bacterium]|nr:hypothetical protein [Cyclobacteriaceae bacterium]HMV10437.1 hypothetical protein [Cyclobacteriaceae bacterium]HMX01360.1 hypothetical protein [Cyclobacteriaceae bacterium]HMX50369.1 hypothetical protein [Cyclobacteriaceae bacterium]HMY92438.1 hypothetical protein [Cyclobacteriaceae bacterium]
MENKLLKGNLLVETDLKDSSVTRLLSDLPRTGKKIKTIRSFKNLLVLKLATDQCLLVFKKKRSRQGWTGIECLAIINRSAFNFYNLICDAEPLLNKRWPRLNVFMNLNTASRKHKRLIEGLMRAGWRPSGYKSARLQMLMKVFPEPESAP